MSKCVYCGKTYDFHRGLTLAMNDGTINYFCSAKCRKSKFMKRRNVRWISKAKKSKEDLKKEVLAIAEEASEKSVEVSKEEPKKEKTKGEPEKEEKPKEDKKEEKVEEKK